MERVISFVGLGVFILLAWGLSSNRRAFPLKLVAGGLALQFGLGLFVLKTQFGQDLFQSVGDAISSLIAVSDQGAQFVFGQGFEEHFFAFKVLPTVVFVASLSGALFHLGVLQAVIGFLAKGLKRILPISGVEAMLASANVFLGQTESPLLVKPFLARMTRSEIMVMMSSGMATVSGGVLAAFVGMGIDARHLLSASLMSAPAAIVIAKIMVPEREQPLTLGSVPHGKEKDQSNLMAALCEGASDGLKLALNIAAMLIAFVGLIHLFNLLLGVVLEPFGFAITLEEILGVLGQPFAFLLGIPLTEVKEVGELIGTKVVINEFIAYIQLSELMKAGEALSPRSQMIATYALCGFANFSSVGIQIGGIGSLVPERRADFASLGLKAMIAGNLAAFMTAAVSGIIMG